MCMFSAPPRNLRPLRIHGSETMSSNRNYIKRGLSFYKRNGLISSVKKAMEKLSDSDRAGQDYEPPFVDDTTIIAQKNHVFEHPYKFSILVPVYETDPELLARTLRSVGEQTYGNWELIIADGSRDESRREVVRAFMEDYTLVCRDHFGAISEKVVYVRLPENKGIAGNTNEALYHAHGDYVGLLDHDDLLEITALFDIMFAIEEKENEGRLAESITKVSAVYTDEDKVSEDGGQYFDLHEKPDFDPVLLLTNNYICHFFVADTNIAKSVGGFRPGYDGAQDHDFILRCTEGLPREQILHIPKVLYHWRSTADSTAENPDAKLYAYEAGKRAVADHLKRQGINAKVTDSPDLGFFRIGYERYHRPVMRVATEDLNPAMLDSEFVMVLSSSLMPLNNEYIADMMGCMRHPNVGAVTGKIIGRDKKVESAGFDIDADGNMVPMYAGLSRHFSGYMHRANLDRLVKGYSNDCVLFRRSALSTSGDWVRLKDGYDIYYTPKAIFTRRGV